MRAATKPGRGRAASARGQGSLGFEETVEVALTEGAASASGPLLVGVEPHAQEDVSAAETELLRLADYVYAHTSLKPMSKTLFFLSRCLLVARRASLTASRQGLVTSYRRVCDDLGASRPVDDYEFDAVLGECEDHLAVLVDGVRRIAALTQRSDSLGLVFNTLLRGKYEGGEGLGTHLTPEEVVQPMVRMLLHAVGEDVMGRVLHSRHALLFGDICGGTGRFVYAFYRLLTANGLTKERAEENARLFDQSSLAVEFGRLNFLFDGVAPHCKTVGDSLVAPEVSRLKGRFGLLATNPPFGTGKYRWNKGVEEALGRDFLGMIGLAGEGQTADPALLFLFRNLDLLADGGGLAIVLPDGIIQARDFVGALEAYERSRGVRVSMEVLVSLPVATFSLGGTVAKTSFLVLRRNALGPERSLFVGVARHIGFLKRGNRRVQDPGGNDADRIATSFAKGEKRDGERSWRSFDRLVAGAMAHRPREGHAMAARRELRSLVQPVREFVTVPEGEDNGHFHVSILDVDETGLIEVTLAARNRPVTKALRCEPGDIVVSCLNPKIWRVACIPNVPGTWSCSPEFTVLRPRNRRQAWAIYVGLHRGSAMQAVQALAGGTSSSRQRVQKGEVLGVEIFVDDAVSSPLREHAKSRTEWYLARLREWRAYRAIHEHDGEFKT